MINSSYSFYPVFLYGYHMRLVARRCEDGILRLCWPCQVRRYQVMARDLGTASGGIKGLDQG